MLQDLSDITTDDVLSELTSFGAAVSDAMPQINYAGFSLYSVLLPELLAAVKCTASLPQPLSIGFSWNILDAVLQIIGGGIQVYSAIKGDINHRELTGIEGGVNIASGVQLIALTALSVTLGAIGFAVAFGVATVIGMKNTAISVRKSVDEDYWFSDSLDILTVSRKKYEEAKEARLNRNSKFNAIPNEVPDDNNIVDEINHINNNASPNEKLPPETLGPVAKMILKFVNNRLKESQENIQDLQTEIFARLVTNYVEKGDKSYLHTKKVDINQFTASQQACLTGLKNNPINGKGQNEARKTQVNQVLTPYHRNPPKGLLTTLVACETATQKSKENSRNEWKLKLLETFYIGVAFAGMVCMCVPGAQYIAYACIGSASGYFAGKYGAQVVSGAKSIYRFFKEEQPKNILGELAQPAGTFIHTQPVYNHSSGRRRVGEK